MHRRGERLAQLHGRSSSIQARTAASAKIAPVVPNPRTKSTSRPGGPAAHRYHHGLLRSETRVARRVSFIGNGRGHKPLHEAVRASDIEDRPISDLFPKSA